MSTKLEKNFTYGDLWSHASVEKTGSGQTLISPEKYTSNTAFLKYLKDNHYRVVLDYDFQGLAQTEIKERIIRLNGNYSDALITAFLQHELGHLMLFNVNQFVTVGTETLRSLITEIIYTPAHLIKYGIEQLLFTENIVQDVIIETVVNNNCVCHTFLTELRTNAGVKHLAQLENVKHITKEVCSNILVPKSQYEEHPELADAMQEILEKMLENLEEDLGEARRKQEQEQKSDKHNHNQTYRTYQHKNKLSRQLDSLKKKTERLGELPPRLEEIKKELEEKLEELNSPEQAARDKAEAERLKQETLRKLAAKIQKKEDLKKALEEEIESLEANENAPEGRGRDSGDGAGEQGDAGSAGADGAYRDKDSQISKNLTDHLTPDGTMPGHSHSYDCGFPMPTTVTRDESRQNEHHLVRMNTKTTVKKITIDEDLADNLTRGTKKIPEKELTYFKASKKEFAPSDMLQGKRQLRASGINVFIGLDISGSMSREWTTMFKDLSAMIEKISLTLDIENVIYFTYNHRLQAHSKKITDLELKASGGNAFGYVYQQLMQTLPIHQRNEIILVTDCGDNLGFKLDEACEVQRKGELVKNHISIIDTENAGFYDKSGIHKADWSLHRKDDKNLFKSLEANIEDLLAY